MDWEIKVWVMHKYGAQGEVSPKFKKLEEKYQTVLHKFGMKNHN